MGSYGDFDGNSRVILGDGKRLAVVHATRGCKEAKANARLIVAAPEMLAQLRAVLEWIDEVRLCPTILSEDGRRGIVDAIAKAEGRSK